MYSYIYTQLHHKCSHRLFCSSHTDSLSSGLGKAIGIGMGCDFSIFLLGGTWWYPLVN